MFVFGINLPVAEILFVLLLLLIVAVAFIIVQLIKMGKHIRVLDETTLEIRRYEAEEEIALKPLDSRVGAIRTAERRLLKRTFLPGVTRIERYAADELLAGRTPSEVKSALMRRGLREQLATRSVNAATWSLNRFVAISAEEARSDARRFRAAAKAK